MKRYTSNALRPFARHFTFKLISVFAFLAITGAACESALTTNSEFEPESEPEEPEPDDPGVQYITEVVAAAGADREVLEGTRVVLDGSASRALDGELDLTWSQISGEPVLLTNPSGSNPAFVAPLGPSTLVFQLRAESSFHNNVDSVTIEVTDSPSRAPFYVSVPPDSIGSRYAEISFRAQAVGAGPGGVSFVARPICDATAAATPDGTVMVTLARALPCAIAVSAVHENGLESAPSIHVIWPEDTVLPPETTFIDSPTLLSPGQQSALRFDAAQLAAAGATARTWTTGELLHLDTVVDTTDVPFTAPLQRGRIALAAEARLGVVSGGVKIVLAEVSAGAGNRAPTANAGPAREVQPGGSFAIDVSATTDLDNDPLDIRVVQVIGQPATADSTVPFTFNAPEVEGTMLFHVIANDGVVDSAPASVRVTVTSTAENTPPVLELDPIRYVQPGAAFTLDASGAVDSSGVVAGYSITQEQTDEIILLSEPVDSSSITLTAGAEGEAYRFRLSAIDVEGLRGIAEVEVRVETAGPFVDPVRGSPEGDGTAQAPFATLAAAVDVATRHRLDELRLVDGLHAPWTGEYPAGLSLRGGFRFDGVEYAPDETAETIVPVGESGLVFFDATVSNVTLRLTDPDTTVEAKGSATFDEVTVTESAVHTGPLLFVGPGAAVTLNQCSLVPTALVTSGNTVTVDIHGSETATTSVDLQQTVIHAGVGGERTALACTNADVSVVEGSMTGAHDATLATGIVATDCSLELLGATVNGGDGTPTATGLDLLRTLLFLDGESVVRAIADDGDAEANPIATENAVGLRFRGAAVGVVQGSIFTHDDIETAESATGLLTESATLSLDGANVEAKANTTAIAANVRTQDFRATSSTFSAVTVARDSAEARATGVRVSGESLQLDSCSLQASGSNARGVEGDAASNNHNARILLSDVTVTGDISAVGVALANASGTLLSSTDIVAEGLDNATPVLGLTALQSTVRSTTVNVLSVLDASGIVLGLGATPSVIERSSVVVESETASAVAVLGNGDLNFRSSAAFATARVVEQPAVALDARGALVLLHGTLVSNETGLALDNDGAAIVLWNSAFAAPTAIVTTESVAFPTDSVALGFDADTVLARAAGDITDVDAFSAEACTACLAFVQIETLNADGRLLDGDNVLVDAGSSAITDALDIDGDTRPQGSAPDIGCDERVPQ